MSITTSVSRFAEYLRRHGIRATATRAVQAGRRALFENRMAVFYCDLDERKMRVVNMPKTFAIRRVNSLAELGPERFGEITSSWNPKLADRNTRERFGRGASLWLVECENRLAGYGWTLRGGTIAAYYFPLGSNDVQLFDFFVFPKFRGRALHWLLTSYILRELASEGCSRAFADTGEWNKAQLAAFKMTPFRFLGFVQTYRMLGREFSHWTAEPQANPSEKGATHKIKARCEVQ